MNRQSKAAFAFLCITAKTPALAGTCALCREALQSGGSAGLLKGFYWSIVLIVTISSIFLILGIRLAIKVYRAHD